MNKLSEYEFIYFVMALDKGYRYIAKNTLNETALYRKLPELYVTATFESGLKIKQEVASERGVISFVDLDIDKPIPIIELIFDYMKG